MREVDCDDCRKRFLNCVADTYFEGLHFGDRGELVHGSDWLTIALCPNEV
jgi:hypothetical protein